MTQEVLEYSRGSSTRALNLQPILLHVLLQDILAVIAPNFIAQQIVIKTDFYDSGEIMVDGEKIQRVCMNLISNARDAMLTEALWRSALVPFTTLSNSNLQIPVVECHQSFRPVCLSRLSLRANHTAQA